MEQSQDMATLNQLMDYTIRHSNLNGKIYVSVYRFSDCGGYGYTAGMLLKTQLIRFNASMYLVNEGDGHVDIYIVRTYNIEENITVFITCEHKIIKNEATGNQLKLYVIIYCVFVIIFIHFLFMIRK